MYVLIIWTLLVNFTLVVEWISWWSDCDCVAKDGKTPQASVKCLGEWTVLGKGGNVLMQGYVCTTVLYYVLAGVKVSWYAVADRVQKTYTYREVYSWYAVECCAWKSYTYIGIQMVCRVCFWRQPSSLATYQLIGFVCKHAEVIQRKIYNSTNSERLKQWLPNLGLTLYCKTNENRNMFWTTISDFCCCHFLVYDTLAMQIQTMYKFTTGQVWINTCTFWIYNCTKVVPLHVRINFVNMKHRHCKVAHYIWRISSGFGYPVSQIFMRQLAAPPECLAFWVPRGFWTWRAAASVACVPATF